MALEDLKSEEEIHQLSVRQCKELLSLHRVNYSGVREKSELLNKIKILWDDYCNSRKGGLCDVVVGLLCWPP